VLITGASKGIGAGCARAFAAEGCHLHLAARDGAAMQTLADELRAQHGVEASVHAVDLSQADSVTALAAACPQVDVLVNNAGDIPGGNIDEVDAQAWRRSYDLKLYGYIDLTRAVYAGMRERGSGVILCDIGNAGERYDYDYIAGTTGNAALMAFTRALGGRSLDHGVRVVGINPGPVATDRIIRLLKKRAKSTLGDENRYLELMARYPLGRAARVEEITDLMLFLASDRSSYTSGAIFTVDGGITSRSSII